MTQPITHARIGYDSIGTRGTVSASAALTGFPASAAASPLTYSFWSAGLPSTWEVALDEPETCNYFGIAAHTLHTNHVLAVLQAYIDTEWQTLPLITPVGEIWRWDGDLFGERSAAYGSTVAALRSGVAGDGHDIVDADGFAESHLGSRASAAVEPAVTNLFPSNVRNAGDTDEDLTDFNPSRADATYSTVHRVSGAGCLLIDNGASSARLEADPVAITATNAYSFQVKIFPVTPILVVTLSARNQADSIRESELFYDLPVGKWTVLKLENVPTFGGDTALSFRISWSSGGDSAYVDELQMQEGEYSHTWVDGSRGLGDLAYQPEIMHQLSGAVTFNVWLKHRDVGGIQMFMDIRNTAGAPGLPDLCQFFTTGPFYRFNIGRDGESPRYVEYDASAEDDGWHMLTGAADDSGSYLYFDGALKDSNASASLPDWSKMDQFHVGHNAGSDQAGREGTTLYGETFVVNRAATAAEVLAWYNSGAPIEATDIDLPSHDDDRPIMRLVEESARSDRFRVRLAGQTTPVVGVIYIGKALEMERPLYAGHTPINLARSTVVRPNVSAGGQFLGRSIIRAGSKGSWSWSNLTAAWIREYLDPFLISARTTPFFILWRPNRFPGEAGYCWTMGDQIPTNTGPQALMSFTLDAEGLGVE